MTKDKKNKKDTPDEVWKKWINGLTDDAGKPAVTPSDALDMYTKPSVPVEWSTPIYYSDKDVKFTTSWHDTWKADYGYPGASSHSTSYKPMTYASPIALPEPVYFTGSDSKKANSSKPPLSPPPSYKLSTGNVPAYMNVTLPPYRVQLPANITAERAFKAYGHLADCRPGAELNHYGVLKCLCGWDGATGSSSFDKHQAEMLKEKNKPEILFDEIDLEF